MSAEQERRAGTAISLGDSYAILAVEAIHVQSGCETIRIAQPGSFAQTWLDHMDGLAHFLSGLDGPVTIFLHVGTCDEHADSWGVSPEVTAGRVDDLVEELLAIRRDLVVIQPRYYGDARSRFFDHLTLRSPRYEVVETSRLEGRIPMRDANHPSDAGFAHHVSEIYRVSILARATRCLRPPPPALGR